MLLAAKKITQKPSALALGHRQDAEAEVEHIDSTSLVELPPVSGSRRQRHLARRRDDILLDRAHADECTWCRGRAHQVPCRAGRAGYVNYVAPAIILLTVAGAATRTAISVATDMNEGIIDRSRIMAIWRPSVLPGHVVAAMIESLLAVAVVIAVAVGVGFRPAAGAIGWLGPAGVLAMVTLALTRLGGWSPRVSRAARWVIRSSSALAGAPASRSLATFGR